MSSTPTTQSKHKMFIFACDTLTHNVMNGLATPSNIDRAPSMDTRRDVTGSYCEAEAAHHSLVALLDVTDSSRCNDPSILAVMMRLTVPCSLQNSSLYKNNSNLYKQ